MKDSILDYLQSSGADPAIIEMYIKKKTSLGIYQMFFMENMNLSPLVAVAVKEALLSTGENISE